MSKERTPVLTRRQVEELARYRPHPYLVSSLYLDLARTSPGRAGTGSSQLRSLVREARAGLDGRGLTRKQRQSAEQDLAALERVVRDARARGARAVGAFLASGADYEQVMDLPHPVKSRLLLDETPHVRPLAVMLAEYPRYLVVLVDRTRARFIAVHLGRVRELQSLASDVPGQVREGGYRGLAESGISRHVEDHVGRHVKRVAEATREAFGDRDYDWVILGGPAEAVAGLEEALNPVLRPHLAGRIVADLTASPEEVAGLCQSRTIANLARRDGELVDRLAGAVAADGLGVAGMAATLGAQRRGAVAALLVEEAHEEPGAECRACGFLTVAPDGEASCPACGQVAFRRLPDLVREVVDRAVAGGAEVWHIGSAPSAGRLRAMGAIGALLRFRLV